MKPRKLVPLFLILVLLLSACGKSSRGATYPIDAAFRAAYNDLGGKDLLGLGISKPFDFNGSTCQYTISALLCLAPGGAEPTQVRLFPLGATLIHTGEPGEETPTTDSLTLNGIPVYEEFIPLYKQLTGAPVTGYPLARARMNYSQQRIEQYFENVGFYRNFSEDPGSVHLLAYGAVACGDLCNFTPAVDAVVSTSAIPQTDRAFLEGLEKLGDATIFGEPLTRAFLAADGMQEQVFRNAALYTTPGSNVLHLRSVPVMVNMPSAPAGPKLYDNKEGMVFFAVKGSLGYHVPILFDEFIASHGGTAISGMPIAEVSEVSPGLYRQCFENYCLLYSPADPPGSQLELEAIGSAYLQSISPADFYGETVVLSPSTVALKVAAQYLLLQPKQVQQILISLHSQLDNQPVAAIESLLTVTLPDGKVHEASLPATLADGSALVNVPFLEDVPNGSVLLYRVCLTGIIAQPVCATGSYLQMKLP